MPPKPLSRKAWLAGYVPTEKDRHIESAWLDEHWMYGRRIHEETADAIVAALGNASSREVGHGLFFKLFAEFANALEVAGAWGWAIRTRRDHRLLLDAFLTYPHGAPDEFYAAARRNRSGSLVRLLDLPAEAKVVDAVAALMPPSTVDDHRALLAGAVPEAKALAGRYFTDTKIIPSTYNRAKHGATLLSDESLPQQQFWVIAPHYDVTGPADTSRYDLPRFTVDRKQVESTRRWLGRAAAMIQYFAGLAKALNDADLLYPPRHTTSRIPARIPPRRSGVGRR